MRSLAFFHVALLLLAIGLAERSLGPHGARLSSLLALVAVLPPAVHLIHAVSWRSLRVWVLAAGVLAGLFGFYSLDGPVRFFSLAASFAWLAVARRADRRDPATLLVLTAFGYAVFAAARDHVTLWPLLVAISDRVSASVTGLVGSPARLGPTYSGLWLAAAFLIAAAGHVFLHRPRPARWVPALALFLLAVPAALALGSRAPGHFHGVEPRVILGWRILLFVLLLAPLGVLTLRRPPSDSEKNRREAARRSAPGAWVAAALVLAGLGALTWSTPVAPGPARILLDTRGSFNMTPLEWGKYGSFAPQGASLASLPPVLDALGFDLATRDTILASDLKERDVLVVMNPTAHYSSEEHAAIWRFVEDGGGLLVLGDHTDIMGTMRPINALLAPCGIRLNFDSAIPLVPRWTWYECIRVHPHPLTRAVRDEGDLKVSVGASLTLSGDAVPLLGGRDAFSDAGDVMNLTGAFLGNMAHDRAEPKGDLFLAAEAPHGRGKVIVFGDTSMFQRTNLSFTYEFVARVFTYLAAPGTAVAPRGLRIAGALLLLGGGLALLWWLPRSLPALAAACTLAAVWLSVLAHRAEVRLPDAPLTGPIAWVDLSHGNRVDIHAGRDDGINGLNNHLWREGYVPLGAKRFDPGMLERAEVFVTVAPAFPYPAEEREALRRFVENGGLLVVAAGFEERAGALQLLREFGYEIGASPIGAAHDAKTMLETQGVLMYEAWPVRSSGGGGEVLVECWGYPLVVHEPVGEGDLIVIGDSGFLCDVRLESSDTFVEPNIKFLRAAIERAVGGSGGGS